MQNRNIFQWQILNNSGVGNASCDMAQHPVRFAFYAELTISLEDGRAAGGKGAEQQGQVLPLASPVSAKGPTKNHLAASPSASARERLPICIGRLGRFDPNARYFPLWLRISGARGSVHEYSGHDTFPAQWVLIFSFDRGNRNHIARDSSFYYDVQILGQLLWCQSVFKHAIGIPSHDRVS